MACGARGDSGAAHSVGSGPTLASGSGRDALPSLAEAPEPRWGAPRARARPWNRSSSRPQRARSPLRTPRTRTQDLICYQSHRRRPPPPPRLLLLGRMEMLRCLTSTSCSTSWMPRLTRPRPRRRAGARPSRPPGGSCAASRSRRRGRAAPLRTPPLRPRGQVPRVDLRRRRGAGWRRLGGGGVLCTWPASADAGGARHSVG